MTDEIKPNLLKPRWSKVISDLWDNKMRTLLVVASIAIGVFAIGMIMSAYVIMGEDINVSYMANNPMNIEMWTDPFQEDFIRTIERVPGVDYAEGALIYQLRGRGEGEVWQSLTFLAIDDFRDTSVNRLNVLEGTQYPKRGELIVSFDFMRDSGLSVGDNVEIEMPDGSRHILPLVGLVSDQVNSDPSSGTRFNAYVTMDTLSLLGLPNNFNRVWVAIDGDGGDEDLIAEVAEAVEDRIERNQRQVYRTKTLISTEHPMASTTLAILGVLGALGGLITILSSSLIVNTLNALLTQHLRQIGVMKLIGGRSLQILGMYLLLIFSYGVIALIITVPTGAIAGYAFANFMVTLMGGSLQGFRIVPMAIFLQVVIAFLIPLVAGFFPVNKGSRINVRQAISNDRPGNQPTQLDLLSRITNMFNFISRPVLLSVRNTFRKKGRLVLTIFTLTIAGAVFIAVFNVQASLGNFMGKLFQHFMGDVTVTFSQPYPINRVNQVLLPIPGVEEMEGWGGAGGEILDEQDNLVANLGILAPPSDTNLLDADIIAGRWTTKGEKNAIVISDTIYNFYPDLEPGDQLAVKIRGKRVEDWTVVGVFRFIDMLGDPIGYADFDFISDLINLPNQASTYRLTIDSEDAEVHEEIGLFIDQYLQDRGFLVSNVEMGETMREDSGKGINILVTFLFVMALLTAFVGSIGLTGTMGMNVLERTREIGVMRAIGAVDFVIMQSVVIEGLIIGLITWLLAIVLSFPISSVLLKIIAEAMMGTSMDLTYTSLGIFIWLIVVIVLSFAASILPARNAARLTIREVLAYE